MSSKKKQPSQPRTGKQPSPHSSSKKPKSKRQKTANSGLRLRIILITALVFLAGILVFTDISVVSTNAMMPSLSKGDIVVSFTPLFFSYTYTEGQILKLNTGDQPTHPNFLRLIATGKHEVSYQSSIIVDGRPIPQTRLTNQAIARPENQPEIWREDLPNGTQYQISTAPGALTGNHDETFTLDDDHIFVLGDNRTGSYDSRHDGPSAKDRIQGHALFVLYSSRNDALFGHFFKLLD